MLNNIKGNLKTQIKAIQLKQNITFKKRYIIKKDQKNQSQNEKYVHHSDASCPPS